MAPSAARPARRWPALTAAAVVALLAAGCAHGDHEPLTPPTSTPAGTPTTAAPVTTEPPGGDDADASDDAAPGGVPGVRPDGFETVGARITSADGEVCEVCLWLADDGDDRARGLMGVTDLGGAAGMAFTWPLPTSGAFWMFNTPTPLEIHWVDRDGAVIGAAEMEPCLVEDSSQCQRYAPDGEYVLAIETFIGGAAAIDLGLGATVELIDGDVVCAGVG